MRPWPEDRLAFGGDYNPEQWPRSTWREDMELMLEAGVSFVTLGVFSWSWLEPARGEYDFAWLEAMDLLHDNGTAVDLAPATATPPPWIPHVLSTYAEGPLAGRPASTRRSVGGGSAWYLSTLPDDDTLTMLLARLAEAAGVGPASSVPRGVEVVRRRGSNGSWLFLINDTGAEQRVDVTGHDLVTDRPVGPAVLPPGGVAVVRES